MKHTHTRPCVSLLFPFFSDAVTKAAVTSVETKQKAPSVDLEESPGGSVAAAGFTSSGGFEGNFIDDDFGLSSIQKESEQLRQQQLLIEEEVSYCIRDWHIRAAVE